jgi:ABC-2 type transport system permease protein
MTANDEEQGILDTLLSLPVPRWRVIVERFAAFTLILLLVVALTFGGLWLGTRLITLEINAGRMVEASINLIPTMLVTMTITVFAAALLRRRAAAAGLAVVVVIGSYFVDFIGRSATGTLADQLRMASYFSYYGGESVIRDGLNTGNLTLLLVVTGLLLAGSVWLFQRRDIGA